MKTLLRLLGSLYLLALAAGCGEEGERARKELGEAARAVSDYTFEMKEKFAASFQENLGHLEDDLETLRARTEKATAEARRDLEPRLAELRARADQLKRELEAARTTTAERWEDARRRCDESMRDLKAALEKAWADFEKER